MVEAAAPLQSISIPRTENRTLPTPHVVYAILISLPVRSWTVYRRYNDFVKLHQTFTTSKQFLGAPPAPLPPKHVARSTIRAITGLGGLMPQGEASRESDEQLLQERRQALEGYLRAILASSDGTWRESEEFRDFIELPKGQQSTASIMGVRGGSSSNDEGGGRRRYVPGSYSAGVSSFASHSSSNNGIGSRSIETTSSQGGPATRVLGQKAVTPVQESAATRVLDDRGLMSAQQDQMDSQDRQLEGLAAILRRQKAMGMAINQELLEQDDLLTDLDQHVDQTQNKMRSAERQMDRL